MQWRLRACHANAGFALKATAARTSHHGLAPRVRGLPLVQRFPKGRGPITTSATRRARAASSRALPPPRDSQNSGACARAIGGHSSHGTPRSCTERERPSGGAVPFHGARTNHDQRNMAHARGKLTCLATSRETASAVAPVYVPRKCRVRVGGHIPHVAPRSCAERERPSAGVAPFYSARIDHNQCSTSRARVKLTCFAIS